MKARIVHVLLVLPLWLLLAASGWAWTDPPGRVGRLSHIVGSVTLRSVDAPEGVAASVNWPLTDGDVLTTDEASRAEIRVGSSVLRLAGSSEITVSRIDDDSIRVWLEYGSVAVRVRSADPANAVRIQTREGTAVAAEPGQYRVDTLDTGAIGLSTYNGRLRFEAEIGAAVVNAGQRMEVWYANELEFRTTEPFYDDFSVWSMSRDREDDGREPPRYVSREMTGVEDLQEYGDWDHDASYGAVWYPRTVPSDWAPYRWGRWVWVDPWGWTWLDDAPWGFAPFHYGRWALVRGRWAWLPGSYVSRPVYAPALVVWLGAPSVSIRFSSGYGPAVGWFPLGPREVYIPGYRCSTPYVRQVNVTHVTNVTYIHEVLRSPERGRHIYRGHRDAVTVAPIEALREGKAIERVRVRDPERWVREAPIARAAPIESEPPRRTAGVRNPFERMNEEAAAERSKEVERGRQPSPVNPFERLGEQDPARRAVEKREGRTSREGREARERDEAAESLQERGGGSRVERGRQPVPVNPFERMGEQEPAERAVEVERRRQAAPVNPFERMGEARQPAQPPAEVIRERSRNDGSAGRRADYPSPMPAPQTEPRERVERRTPAQPFNPFESMGGTRPDERPAPVERPSRAAPVNPFERASEPAPRIQPARPSPPAAPPAPRMPSPPARVERSPEPPRAPQPSASPRNPFERMQQESRSQKSEPAAQGRQQAVPNNPFERMR